MASLQSSQYGKHRVRVLKVIRHPGGCHDVCELDANVMLTLSTDHSFAGDDNSLVVPTDTVRNTVNLLAHDHLGTNRHAFARVIGRHFLATYAHVAKVDVLLSERAWRRMDGHDHAFSHDANGTPETHGVFSRTDGETLSGGLRGHLILKTTASSFTGYPVCPQTTLPPAEDRILSTRLSARWDFAKDAADGDLEKSDGLVRDALLDVFANTHSPSVQRTLFLMGEAVLAAVPFVERIHLKLPNVHFLNLDLSRLGRPEQREVFLPTDEPHGQIEATVTR
jgi:urate oxidase